MLRSPALAAPHSLSGQLEYIRERWGALLGSYLYRLLSSLDLIQEEEKAIFLGPGPALVLRVWRAGVRAGALQPRPGLDAPPGADGQEHLRLAATSSRKQYERPITRLDQIPDEELDTPGPTGASPGCG